MLNWHQVQSYPKHTRGRKQVLLLQSYKPVDDRVVVCEEIRTEVHHFAVMQVVEIVELIIQSASSDGSF